MKEQTKILFLGISLLFGFSACRPEVDAKEVKAGDIDASRFVAIGGASMGGFMDDALYYEGQENSLGTILHGQLALIGTNQFIVPLMTTSVYGCNADGNSCFELGYKTDCLGVTSLSPVRVSPTGDLSNFNLNLFSSLVPYNNLGIPLLRSTALNQTGYGDPTSGAGNYNPYYARMASDQTNGKVINDAVAKNPTFFAFNVGIDEVISFARKGAAVGTMTPVNGADGVGFDGSVSNALDQLTANGAKGVISTIPDVTDLPYFTTIPYNGLNLNAEKAASLNEIYNPIGIYFQEGPNPFMILDPSAGAFGMRLMEPGELVLLSAPLDSVKCYQMGSVFPFRDEFILTNAELANIRAKIDGYNAVIEQEALTNNLALVDLHTLYKKLVTGLIYNGITLNMKFVSGGVVSLDGLNFNPKGNALVANEFIKAMNSKYGSSIPLVDVTNYKSTIFP